MKCFLALRVAPADRLEDIVRHAAGLPRHPDRVLALLWIRRVVDDPEAATEKSSIGTPSLGGPARHLGVRPIGLGDEVMQRLVPGAGMQRIDPRRHRFHILACSRQDQSGAVVPQPRVPVGMAESARQMFHVAPKPIARTRRSSRKARRRAYSALNLTTQ